MPIFRVQGADGKVYRVEAPAGTPESDLANAVEAQFPYAGKTTGELESAPSAPFSAGNLFKGLSSGALGATKSLVDVFGAGSGISKGLGEAAEFLESKKTPERIEEIRRRQELIDRAERSGSTLKEIGAYLGAVGEAPLESTFSAIGSTTPSIIAGLAALPVDAPVALGLGVATIARIATGAAQGVGEYKGNVFDAVKQEYMKKGYKEKDAEELASKAQEYSANKALQLGGSALLGALDAYTGIESTASKELKQAFKKPTKELAIEEAYQAIKGTKPIEKPNVLKSYLSSAAGEAPLEGLQGGFGQYAQNLALQQEGFQKDPYQGVLGSAARDAAVGALAGGAFGHLHHMEGAREFALDQFVRQEGSAREFEKKRQEFAQQEAEKRAATEEQLGVPRTLALGYEQKADEEKYTNPAANIKKNELMPDEVKFVDNYRRQNGLPPLKSYSIEDVKDAMPGVDPEGEQGRIDSILAAKYGYKPVDDNTGKPVNYTPDDVISAAEDEKNIATGTKGFNDFLIRTTGSSDLNTMTQPQLFAAFQAIKQMPASETKVILPEGTGASRFTDKQYKKAVSWFGQTFEGVGNQPLSRDTIIGDIQEATGLEQKHDAEALLDTAVKNGDLAETEERVFRTYDDNGKLVSTYRDKAKADAAAKKQGLNVKEETLKQLTPPPQAEPAKRANLPAGYEMTKETIKTGEVPAGFEIFPEGRGKALVTVPTQEELQAKIESLTGARQKEAAKALTNMDRDVATLKRARENLESMEARGEVGSQAYELAKTRLAKQERVLGKRIERHMDRIAAYNEPLKSRPTEAKKQVTREKITVTKQGKALGSFPDNVKAQEAILVQMTDDELAATAADGRLGAIADRAAKELERRKQPAGIAVKRSPKKTEPVEDTTPEFKAAADEISKKLLPILQRMGLGQVGLNIVKEIKNGGEGSYGSSLIKIILGAEKPLEVLHHESLHALKNLGFFTPQQWSVLEKKADDVWINKYLKSQTSKYVKDGVEKTASRYDAYVDLGLNEDEIREEAIADAFADFATTKPPGGMISSILKRLNDLFRAIKNALNRSGFETAEDIFGKAQRGELKQSEANAWQATPEDIEKAEKYSIKNGILPYVSAGNLELPLETPKFSLKKLDKHGIDPTFNIPLNKDGTITVYYHTTKDNALKINNEKAIKTDGKRIYLTNESSGALVLENKGNFDQEIDGAVVIMKLPPSMLQLDKAYDNGRKDMYVSVKQGAFFDEKMRMSAIQVSKNTPILKKGETFSYSEYSKRITDALNEFNKLSPKEQKLRMDEVRNFMKEQHNIGTLITENGKLEKTREVGLKNQETDVASMGLGLAAAQKISDKLSTCPNSAICMDLCLGDTAGGNQQYGGVAAKDVNGIEKSAFRAGPRMAQYLKTEALVIHPEEFALMLNDEIAKFKNWAKKNEYEPSIRLNVTSDIKPEFWSSLIAAHPDVIFYDYTKLNGDAIAPNHHLTYSSTGFGQIIDGKYVSHKTNNWPAMRGRLDRGFNVAMAFTSKSALPDQVIDNETGKVYKVWDGDNYDARYLDPKQENGVGMVIGLRNKAGTMKEATSTIDTDGFFVDYDPKRDGNFVLVANQGQFKNKVIPIAQEKLSLRSTRQPPESKEFKNWFTGSYFTSGGEPLIMYHGTARDITIFKGKQAKAIFVTTKPDVAETYSNMGVDYMRTEAYKALTRDEKVELINTVAEQAERDGNITPKEVKEIASELKKRVPTVEKNSIIGLPYQIEGEIIESLNNLLPTKGNIMPVYVNAKNVFDYANKDDVNKVFDWMTNNSTALGRMDNPEAWLKSIKGLISRGNWVRIESEPVQEAIRALGFDGFSVLEAGTKNYAVYNPTAIKSVTGNIGTFGLGEISTEQAARLSMTPEQARQAQAEGDIRLSLRNSVSPQINAAIDKTTYVREEKGFVERMMDAISPKSWSDFRSKALNRYNAMSVADKKRAEKMGGAALLADQSAEAAALMSDLAAGVTASALGVHDRNGGAPVFRNGVTTIDSSIKGPVAIFAPLAKLGDPRIYQMWQFYAGAKRARRYYKDGKEQNYTPTDIAYADQLGKQYPEFKQIFEEWNKFNDALVQYQVDTGVLSKERADEYRKYSDYIPFYRQLEDENTLGPKVFQSISGVKGPKKLKGSEAPIADLMETIVRNVQSGIQAGMKNHAARQAIKVFSDIGEAKPTFPSATGPSVVYVMENGQKAAYEVADHGLYNSMQSLNLPELPFIGFFAGPANLLRNLVTKDPGFMLANMVRDSMSAWVTSGVKMTPIASAVKNFTGALRGTAPEYQALLNAGVLGGYEFSQNVEASGKQLKKELAKYGPSTSFGKITKPFTSVWEALEKGTTASDAATRMEVYKNVLAETGNEAEALFRALEVMNFNRKGSSAVIRIMTAAVPFLNARIQGLDVLYRAAFGKMATQDAKAIQKSFFIRGATIMALSMMYWGLTHDDDDYKKQEQETRDNYWLLPKLGVKIPIPFEVGVIFKVIPERIAELTMGTDTTKDFTKAMQRALQSTFGFNPVPQVALPIVEAVTNYSFFTGRAIVGQGLEGVSKEFQVGPTTSQLAKYLGSVTGQSPIMIDHIIGGYTGTFGMYAVDAIDAIVSSNSNVPKASKRFEQMPVLRRFLLDPEARGNVTAYYDLKNATDEAVRTSNFLERTMNFEDLAQYNQDTIKMLASADLVKSMDKDMKELNDMTNIIRHSGMSPDEKRDAIKSINQAQNNLTANIKLIKKSLDQ